MKMNISRFLSATFVLAILLTEPVWAGESTGVRKILYLGCHDTDGTCYVGLDGGAFGVTLGCPLGPMAEFRFDNGDTDVGRRAYASLLAAMLSGKSVVVSLDGCTTQGYPKLLYFAVYA